MQTRDQNTTKSKDGKMKKGEILKEEILQVLTESFMDLLLDMVNQNIQEALKKFQDNKNTEHEKT
jgi:hypothetical protein